MKKTVRIFYGFQLFFSLLLWLPIFYEYQKRIGLNDTEIFRIQSLYYLVFCFLEIPTGMMADRWGHRFCLRLGSMVLVLSNLLPIFAQSYLGFLSHFMLIALARSLVSGASSAYLYEYLKQHSGLNHYKQIEGNARAYGLVAKVICWTFIGALMEWQLTLPYILTSLCSLISVAYTLVLPALLPIEQDKTTDLSASAISSLQRVSSVFRHLYKDPSLIFLMVQGVGIFVLGRICQVNLFQPILSSKSFNLKTFGVVMSLMTIFEAFGSFKPSWLRRKISDLKAIYFLTFLMAVSLMLIPVVGKAMTVAFLCIFSAACGLSYPVQRQLINDAIPDSRFRATFLSVESIIDRAVNAWVAFLVGTFLTNGKLNQFLVASAAFSLCAIAMLFVISYVSGYPHLKREKE